MTTKRTRLAKASEFIIVIALFAATAVAVIWFLSPSKEGKQSAIEKAGGTKAHEEGYNAGFELGTYYVSKGLSIIKGHNLALLSQVRAVNKVGLSPVHRDMFARGFAAGFERGYEQAHGELAR